MSDLLGERWKDEEVRAAMSRPGGACFRQRGEQVPRLRDGPELVLEDEQPSVGGWALVGATEERGECGIRAVLCRPREIGEFYSESNGKPPSHFKQGREII